MQREKLEKVINLHGITEYIKNTAKEKYPCILHID